jgi:hypothetical protein
MPQQPVLCALACRPAGAGATTSSTMAAGGCSNRMPGAVSNCRYKQRTPHAFTHMHASVQFSQGCSGMHHTQGRSCTAAYAKLPGAHSQQQWTALTWRLVAWMFVDVGTPF